jgi:hypothetical protein
MQMQAAVVAISITNLVMANIPLVSVRVRCPAFLERYRPGRVPRIWIAEPAISTQHIRHTFLNRTKSAVPYYVACAN